MISDFQVQRRGDSILLGIATGDAVLDILTNEEHLRDCLAALEAPHRGLVSLEIGKFGDFVVTLCISHDNSTALVVDGPEFESNRSQCAQICLGKGELRQLIHDVLCGKLSL